jgi:hypothetical protein
MDLAMVKQEQGEALRKYMRRFFDKRATVVDITDKEVIDLFQDGLYHCRTFEDFGRHRSKSIPHLKDMITSWADEEDKANAKYDAIRVLTDKRRIPLRSASVRTPHLFHHGIPEVLVNPRSKGITSA